MIERIYHIDNKLEDSIFLFGARQTGKSTFLRQKFPDSIYIDLLDTTLRGVSAVGQKLCFLIYYLYICNI